jgi:hypothetical protein
MNFSRPCATPGCVSLAQPGQTHCPVHRPVLAPDLPRYCKGFRRWLHRPTRRVIVVPSAWSRFTYQGQTYVHEPRALLSAPMLDDGYRYPSKNWERA